MGRSRQDNTKMCHTYQILLNKKTKKKLKTNWVSGTAIANYLMNEPVLDWLNLYYDAKNKPVFNKKNNYQPKRLGTNNIIMNKGLQFETLVYNDLHENSKKMQ